MSNDSVRGKPGRRRGAAVGAVAVEVARGRARAARRRVRRHEQGRHGIFGPPGTLGGSPGSDFGIAVTILPFDQPVTGPVGPLAGPASTDGQPVGDGLRAAPPVGVDVPGQRDRIG